MKRICVLLPTSLVLVLTPAHAAPDEPIWTASISGSWSDIAGSEEDAQSTSLSLSRQTGRASIGGSISSSAGTDSPLETIETLDQSSVFASTWISWPIGDVDMTVSTMLGRETFDGQIDLEDERFDALNGATADISSDVDSFSVNVSASRTFIAGEWDILPSFGIGWSQSETETSATSLSDLSDSLKLLDEENGWSGFLGIGTGYVASDRIYLFADLFGLYAENGASSSTWSSSRFGDLRTSSRQDAEAVSWAELSLGTSLNLTDRLSLSIIGGSTAGREDEEVFVTSALAVNF